MEVDKDLLDNIIMDIDEIPLTENDKTMIKHETSDDDLEEILSAPIDDDVVEKKFEPKSVVPMTLTKIAPKPISTTKTVPGQIVVIQRPGGSTQHIRIGNSPNASASNGPIKLIKTADGKFLRISATKKPAATTTPAHPPVQVKRIISKNSAVPIIANTQSVAANSKPSTQPTGVKRTFTVAQAQQMGLISSSKLKELVSQATAQKQAKLSTTQPSEAVKSTNTTTSSAPKVQKVIIQTSTGEQKQVSLPPNLIKLAQSGQIKAVNVAGKGIQYVRVVGSNSTSNANTSQIVKPTQQTATKAPVASKVYIHNKPQPIQNSKTSLVPCPKPTTSTAGQVRSSHDPMKIGAPLTKAPPANPSTSKGLLIKEEDYVEQSRTHFVLVNKPKFIKVESEMDSSTPVSPRKTQNVTIDTDNDDDISLTMKASPDESIRRKHCNCNKSMCLKLYCDCFANGEFCYNCNCKECFNNLENEEERQRAIRICLDRNPAAFKPKIGKSRDQLDSANRKHTKGCNCKRSGCLKNYCECYEAKIACSDNCKCIGCRNIDMDESMYENNTSVKLSNTFDKSFNERTTADNRLLRELTPPCAHTGIPKRSCNFMTSDVIEATIQCVIAQAEECQKNKMDSMTAEKMILEEFGRCLVEINDFSNKSGSN